MADAWRSARRAKASAVEVIVLTYNHEHFIDCALHSIFEQDTKHTFHVTIHDDASQDGTRAVLERWRARWPERITLILQDENGLSKGINPSITALLQSSSAYFAWCEGDDWWTDPHKLQRQVDFMEANSWCSISHHGVEVVVEDGGDQDYATGIREMMIQEWRTRKRVSRLELAKRNFILTGSAMVRRSALPTRKLRAIHDVQPGDWVTMVLAAQSGDIGYIDEVMSAYRIHGGNLWARSGNELHAEGERALWFLGAHVEGDMRDAIQRYAVELWLRNSSDALDIYGRRLRERVDAAEAELASLRVALADAQNDADEWQRRIGVMENTRGWRLLERLRPVRRLLPPMP